MKNNTERRSLSDRRRRPTPPISRYTFYGGKRRIIRRQRDRDRYLFVDVYSTRLFLIILGVLILSCLDAFLTLSLIHRGVAFEANPVMASVLTYGVMPFTLIKFLLTAIALIVLCVLKNTRLVRITLPLILKIYIILILYEGYLYLG